MSPRQNCTDLQLLNLKLFIYHLLLTISDSKLNTHRYHFIQSVATISTSTAITNMMATVSKMLSKFKFVSLLKIRRKQLTVLSKSLLNFDL